MEQWVEKFQWSLSGTSSDHTLQYIEYGQKLYEKLVAPVAGQLPERVVVVPDGVLGYVPFGALLNGPPTNRRSFNTYPFLVKEHRFSYCYSATLLGEMKDKKHLYEPPKSFAAYSPTYDGDTTLLASRFAHDTTMLKGFRQLEHSLKESNVAAASMGGGDVFTGTGALKGHFMDMAGQYRHLHLSMHARADNRVGDYAFLAFTQQKTTGDDGLLFVRDLYNLQLNADLVVLSACETGTGKLRRGEGIISLARAFAYAGAKGIVTTLWEVNDRSTAEVMGYFYGYLADGLDKDEALREAQLDYLGVEFDKEGNKREMEKKDSPNNILHPYYWASFIPIGDMSPIKK